MNDEKEPLAKYALFVAAISLLLSAFMGWKSIEHNQLSVAPYIDFGIGFVKSENYQSGISIDNAGLGTAIIESVDVFWKENGETEKVENWEKLSVKLGVPHTEVKPLTLIPGNALKPGRKLYLYGVLWNTSASIELQKKQKNIQVVVHYKSLYGKRRKGSLHGDMWFGKDG